MSIFSRKQKINLEDFCRDFYDNYILNPTVEGVDFGTALPDYIVEKIDSVFAHADKQKLTDELMALRFELFALAWTHKFVSGKIVIAQSVFTKHYLYKKGKDNIWSSMHDYNNSIDGATLEWLTKLGKININFNYNMRKDLITKNIEDAQKNGINIDESVDRVNNRIWSENAWIQKFMLVPLAFIFCDRLGLNFNELNPETGFHLTVIISGFYDGAKQSWDKVKIVN